jgi:ligand-binding sensor domain-containing protein
VIVVPDLSRVASEDELEDVMSRLGIEYRIDFLAIPEGEREDGVVAMQEPDPGTQIGTDDMMTIWFYGDPLVTEYPTPDTGTWTYHNTSDGLAADCVTAVAASPDGTVWVGCSDGLSRFADGAWETIAGIGIIDLAASDDGSLWVVSCIDPCDGSGVRRLIDGSWTIYGIQDAFTIASGPNGTAAAGPSSPLSFFDGDQWTTIEGGEGTWVAISPDGPVWASGNETGLMKFTDEWILVSRPPWMSQDDAPGVPAVGSEAIWAAPDGSLWGVGEGLFQYSDGDWTTHLTNVRPMDVAFSGDDVWVATAWNGVYRYDGHEWTQYTTVNGLPSTEITSITVSANGHIWIGTARNGVARLVLEGG